MGASGGDFRDGQVDEIVDADITAVLDAAGREQVVLVGTSVAGPPAIRYAARHPERARSLVLVNAFAHYVRSDDYPFGLPPAYLDRFNLSSPEEWGTEAALQSLAPSKTSDEAFRTWFARCVRLAVPLDQAVAVGQASFLQDVRPLLSQVEVPTLVVHRAGDRYIRVGAGRYLAEHIPGATYVEVPGEDDLFFVGDTDAILDEIEAFLTGGGQAPEGDVVTTTILFTDIVASTEQSARLGHRK